MKDLHESFRNRFKHTKRIDESWSLENDIMIKLIADLGGDKEYTLKITICKDEPTNGTDNLPIRISLKR
jgi:hypothetical protein